MEYAVPRRKKAQRAQYAEADTNCQQILEVF
jgi:hypothetical protein